MTDEYDVILSSTARSTQFVFKTSPLKLNQPYEVGLVSLQTNGLRRPKTSSMLVQMDNIACSNLNDGQRPYLDIVYGNKPINYFNPMYKKYNSNNLNTITIFLTEVDGYSPIVLSSILVRLHFRPCSSM